MIKRMLTFVLLLLLLLSSSARSFLRETHRFTVSSDSVLIQPVFGRVAVRCPYDGAVTFTDADGKVYEIGYITGGLRPTVTLERGHWYTVEAPDELTLWYVNVRPRG